MPKLDFGAISLTRLQQLKQIYFPGLCVSVTVGIAAFFIANRYGTPVMLMALLLGMAFNFLSDDAKCSPGIDFSAKTLLRIGVALLGLRISMEEVIVMGWQPIAIAFISIVFTITLGAILARKMGFNRRFGMLTGGAVAICGASAAMAISSILPQDKTTQKDTLFTVIAVTSLSTVTMVLYPLFADEMNMSAKHIGIFLGGTIHDVAQVVGAGYSVSEEVGDLSTLMKLIRVAMLVPVVLMMGFLIRRFELSASRDSSTKPKFPFFLIGFTLLFFINSLNILPRQVIEFLSQFSSVLLVIAISALGVRTSMKEITSIGWQPIILVVIETIFIAIIVIGLIYLLI